MSLHNDINLSRLHKLIMIDIKSNYKTIILIAATIFLFLFIMLSHETNPIDNYYFILYAGGFVITSRIFNELHDPQKASVYLMIPCSNLERFLNKWFLSAIYYAMGTLLICYLYSLISAILNGFSDRHPIDIFSPSLWIEIWKYLILQSVVLLGAITFKKNPLIKTTFVLGLLSAVLSLFSLLVGWLFFYPNHLGQGIYMIENSLRGWHFIFWIIIAPICWYITYLRITEYELK